MSAAIHPDELAVLAGLLSQNDPKAKPPNPAHISKLVERGCLIEQEGITQYHLRFTPIELWQDYLDWSLDRGATLTRMDIHVYRETSSTQDVAKRLGPNPVVVLADQQSAGRGRLGRRWESSPASAVLMSMRLPMTMCNATHDRMSLIAGLTVARVIEQLHPEARVRLKWPNDVMVDGQKIAGVLIEKVPGAFIVGIGLNVSEAPDLGNESINTSTCLKNLGPAPDRLFLIEQLIIEFQLRLRLSRDVLALWRPRAAIGQIHTFEHNAQHITGEVLDLDPDHGLIVRRDTGEIITLPAATTSVVK